MSSTHRTTCCYCGVGCGIEVSADRRGRLSVAGDASHPVNRGMLCSKGRYLHQVAMDRSDRLLHPEMRASRAHPRVRVSWNDALSRCAAVFRSLIDRHGPESVGFYVSGQLLTEEYYVANKLVKGFIGCNNIDTNSRLCMSSAVAAYKKALGDDLVPICYDDIEAADCILIAGANPAWCHPILFRRMEHRKAADPKVKVLVVDPRTTETTAIADIHLRIRPGTDVTLYSAIAKCLVDSEQIDYEFIKNHIHGFEALRQSLAGLDIERASSTCGVSADLIREAAGIIGQAGRFLSCWAMGLNQCVNGVDKNLALLNLSLITGQIGKPGAGPFSLTGQPNAMGGREVGGLANLLAAHRDLASDADRSFVAQHWGSGPISPAPGLTATEMFDALETGELKALWIVCTNPAVSMPNANRIEAALKKARFVVVQDISNRSETLRFADVVLPAAGWLEKCGTMTNSERRVSYLPKVIDPPGEALPDAEILCRFAKCMGWGAHFAYKSEAEIFEEHTALTSGTRIDMRGISHGRLQSGTLQWPCPSAESTGTQRLFSDGRFATPDGKARVHAVMDSEHCETPTGDYPFVLTTGRIRDQWHTRTKTGKVSRLNQHCGEPFVELNAADAQRLGISDGALVELRNARGLARVKAVITDSVPPGVVFMPMHWGKALESVPACANNLTATRVDPVSKEPDFKYSSVAVRRVAPESGHVVVIGAGTAAHEFALEYLNRSPAGTVEVFGEEPDAFYNRVQLPDLISGAAAWRELAAEPPHNGHRPRLGLHTGVRIAAIDREHRVVRDDRGGVHPYGRLVIATGSRPRIPAELAGVAEHLLTVRNRRDAERIIAAAVPGRSAVVVGGGLLGIELADALDARGVQTVLVHRSARLMGGILDATASRILQSSLEESGISVRLSETIANVRLNESRYSVRLRSGQVIACDFLVVAAGTEANAGIARDAGLTVARGVAVDNALGTSDPHISAIGEVAEHSSGLYGTSAPAREQARVLAERLSGNEAAFYTGSSPSITLKLRAIMISAIGYVSGDGPDSEHAIAVDEHAGYYKKCFIRGNRLVGAILAGPQHEAAQFRRWIEQKLELDEIRRCLLVSDAAVTGKPARGPIICACLNVGAHDVQDAIEAGAQNVVALGCETGAGTGCGSCRTALAKMLRECEPAIRAPEELPA